MQGSMQALEAEREAHVGQRAGLLKQHDAKIRRHEQKATELQVREWSERRNRRTGKKSQ